ncbi:Cytochrome b5, putative [Pediculus humanus corporis]|uniref:Cytochrome b5 n=1 Tax=Pediculus humanus subsp. corporis TaxID=121224 RepID=E0VGZ4_PEDHC|nr:Cytochrome b5, putative [Pediculus humanus corporis]EEB12650.1 Cytochrome b5, putative [Pediculus humanus corporis]
MEEKPVKLFTRNDVSKSKNSKSTQIIIHNIVYDVTEFLNEHPGGEEVLLDHAGKDATEAFEDVGHSRDARDMMSKYKIGELNEEEKVKTTEKTIRDWVEKKNDDHR